MTRLIEHLLPRRRISGISFEQWAEMLQLGAFNQHLTTTMQGNQETIDEHFEGLVQGAYRSNGIVFACEMWRLRLFSQMRFQFQQIRGGQPGALYGTAELAPLEQPEPGRATSDLLDRMLLEADFAGTSFVVRRGARLKTLRPDWTAILIGSRSPTPRQDISPHDVDAEFVGLVYKPGGFGSQDPPEVYSADEARYFAPTPDPLARYRGMPWMVPVLREIMGHSAATTHKLKFFENAATPNVIVTLDPKISLEMAREWIDLFEQEHKGVMNAYRTAYLGGGASGEVVGKDFQQMDFRAVQGASEVAIAISSGMHPVVVGLSEALQGAALNAGNFTAARRLVSDGVLGDLWERAAGTLAPLVSVPPGSRLWYDARHIPFLAEDRKDAAEVVAKKAQSARTMVDGGWVPDAVIDYIDTGDISLLRGQHTGFLPVQLQPPGSGSTTGEPPAAALYYQRVWDPPARSAVEAPAVHATRTFWSSGMPDGPVRHVHVEEGETFTTADRIVRDFPQFFAPAAARLALPGPTSPIVTVEEVTAKREQLRLEGRPAGYDSLARELGVSRDTVRRRLAQGATP